MGGGGPPGLTARTLLARFGKAAFQGEKSIAGELAARGYQVNPPVGAESLREDPRFAGGHTVFTYGSQHSDAIIPVHVVKRRASPTTIAPAIASAVERRDTAHVYQAGACSAWPCASLRPRRALVAPGPPSW